MTLLRTLIIAALQGATELFPVSSLGHAVILPRLLGWQIDQHAPEFLPFLVVLHVGTATALLLYFWRTWLGFGRGVVARAPSAAAERRTFFLVCVATLPAVVIGFTLEHRLRAFFGAPTLAAVFLIVNGGLLFVGDRIRHSGHKSLDQIGWPTALVVGAAQALALIPGISRSGATMVGGLLAGLSYRDAARFSFLMATPVIAGAGALEVPKLIRLLRSGGPVAIHASTAVAAGVVAGTVAWLSTYVLMRYFKDNDVEALNPFAVYCVVAGAVSLAILAA